MSSAALVADGICSYFGGPYDASNHAYNVPQITVANLAGPVFRRGVPKRDDHQADYGMTQAGLPSGCLVMVLLEQGKERRVAVAGAVSGVKLVTWSVKMHCFVRAEVAYGEDLQDTLYDLLDAVRAHIEADRTCGSGGFEAGFGVGFQVAEGGEPWLTWRISPVDNSAKDLSKGYMLLEFEADQYIQA